MVGVSRTGHWCAPIRATAPASSVMAFSRLIIDPWPARIIMLVLMMGIAFLGYVLPYGQMSLWGATVITSMLSAVPWIGGDFVQSRGL